MPQNFDELREYLRAQLLAHAPEPNDLSLHVTVESLDGQRAVTSCATGLRWEVPAGRFRFVVEPRSPVSMDPWVVRLLDGDRIVHEWTLTGVTPDTIRIDVGPEVKAAYLAVDPVHYGPDAIAELRGLAADDT